jgi:hypothetical protein
MFDHQSPTAKAAMDSIALGPIALVLLAGLLLTACVQSETPLLSGTKPVLGDQFQLNLFDDFTDGKADTVRTAVFRWNASRYVLTSGDLLDIKYLVAQPLDDNNSLIQIGNDKEYVYLLSRKLAEGTYRILPVNEKDLDAAAQKRTCATVKGDICTIATRQQLDALVHASLGKTIPYTMTAVISAVK